MPACFKNNFGDRVIVIIDCFGIFTERPSGVTPQGTISYISEAWGGRTSDKFLTENCGFLNLIVPGDVILEDRGFLIRDSVEIVGGHLEIPAFTKGKKQLLPADIETTRPIPISMLSASRDDLSVLDKILVVCSAFINLCPSVISMD
ncbi:hypothetical protein NQ315_003365 [Exocentrus adspersus]|uniref:DDE Tnp4 domain-containing protein n=1 Tax=Exocentrus adspersus TaxID=1586481 RepID=A0AAV8VAG1_9CUCU|nr:hypothetical protein NQ315_003365 [Exocentrus adspersus]